MFHRRFRQRRRYHNDLLLAISCPLPDLAFISGGRLRSNEAHCDNCDNACPLFVGPALDRALRTKRSLIYRAAS